MMAATHWDGLMGKPNPYSHQVKPERIERVQREKFVSKAEKLEMLLRERGPMTAPEIQTAMVWTMPEIRCAIKRSASVKSSCRVVREVETPCTRATVKLKPGALENLSPLRRAARQIGELLQERGELHVEQIHTAINMCPCTARNTVYANLDVFKIVRRKGTTLAKVKFALYECN